MAKKAFIINLRADFKTVINRFKDTRDEVNGSANPNLGNETVLTYLYNEKSLQQQGYSQSAPASMPEIVNENGEYVKQDTVALVYASSETSLRKMLALNSTTQKA